MKRSTTILCLATALFVACGLLPSACTSSSPQSENDTISTLKTTQLPELKMKDFSLEQFQQWEAATLDWQVDAFIHGCLQNAGFKQDCNDCGNVNVGVKLTVDATGTITSITEQDLNIDCGRRTEQEKQAVKACMIESFQKVNLPAPFRDRVLVVSIGRSTMCWAKDMLKVAASRDAITTTQPVQMRKIDGALWSLENGQGLQKWAGAWTWVLRLAGN